MSTNIPVPPTPPMSDKARSVIYGVWSWASVLVFLAASAWVLFGEIPEWVLAVSVVLNGFGSLSGFLAKNNVSPGASSTA